MKNPWKTLSSKVVYQNQYYSIQEDGVIRPDGRQGIYFSLNKIPGVFIVPVTKNNKIVLIGQWRYVTQSYSLELPAGGTEGQDPLLAAKRELQEETGLTADHWEKIGQTHPASGIANTSSMVFLASGLHQTDSHSQVEEGIDQMVELSFAQVLERLKSGEINDGITISSLMLAGIYLGWIK